MSLRTPLCDLLGIQYPIVQSGMGSAAGPELAAEVSRAGGLGIVAGLGVTADELRKRIHHVRSVTDRPFGVNQWLHTELRPPVDPAGVPAATMRAVQTQLNVFRERLGIPTTDKPASGMPDLIDAELAVILEERVPVWSIGLGNPDAAMVRRCHERGIKVMAMVATVEDARAVEANGVDIIVAQGGEAGGHRSTWVKKPREEANVATLTLVPQVVDAVRVPVIAAGGIADGRGLVAALALGAVGALLGTRFVATRESMASEVWKKRLLESDGETTLTEAYTGLWARSLRNRFTEDYADSGAPVLPTLMQQRAALDVFAAAAQQRDPEYTALYAGQSTGLVHDLPGAAEVVERIAREAEAVLVSLRAMGGARPPGQAQELR
jgi:nitronate monooxygenase